ncbi:MAG: hypothetical protein KC708_05905 [Anaerolineae bacterium]|nr:hypothetical protein [Anaerolineae bacterium]
MNKRERLQAAVSGDTVDRTPVIMYRHWPGDDQRAADLAKAHLAFQNQFDWDALIVTPSANYAVADLGVQDIWDGQISGQRTIIRRPITRSLDWTALRVVEPTRGVISQQLNCVQVIKEQLSNDIPIVFQLYSPLTLAAKLAGSQQLLQHLRRQPERVKTGLNIITDSMIRLTSELQRLGVDGFHYVMEHADLGFLTQNEYGEFGATYDWAVLGEMPSQFWLNIVEMRGEAPMVGYLSGYPVQVLAWNTPEVEPDITWGRAAFAGAIMGGLSAETQLHMGTPTTIRDTVKRTITETQRRRFILGAGSPLPVTCAISNLRAAREAVEMRQD